MLNSEQKLEVNGIWQTKSSLKAAVIATGIQNPDDKRYWRVTRSSKEYLSLTCCFAPECSCPAILRASRSSKIQGRPWIIREICLSHSDNCKGKTPKKFFGTDFIKSVLPPDALTSSCADVAKIVQEKSGLQVARRTITRIQKGSKQKNEYVSQILMEFVRKNPGSSASYCDSMVRIIFGHVKNCIDYLLHTLFCTQIELKNNYTLRILALMDGERLPVPLAVGIIPREKNGDEFVYDGLRECFQNDDFVEKLISDVRFPEEHLFSYEFNEFDATLTETVINIINFFSHIFEKRKERIFKHDSKLVLWLVKDIEWKTENANKIEISGEFPLYTINGNNPITVNIKERTCDCGEYQRTQTPCLHAVYVIYQKFNGQYDSFVNQCYFVTSLRALYSVPLHPISLSTIKKTEERKNVCKESSEDEVGKKNVSLEHGGEIQPFNKFEYYDKPHEKFTLK